MNTQFGLNHTANKEIMREEIQEIIKNGPFPIRFPLKGLPQDQEWCEVKIENEWVPIRFHDYHQVYKVPGLYETIFYRTLFCNSPNRITGFLSDIISEMRLDSKEMRALDLGAGNGMSGEALQNLGIRKIIALDILEEAKDACLRDRPWVYDEYLVADLTKLTSETKEILESANLNLLITIAALGFGDIPPLAFYHAFNFIADDGLIAFNIRDHFLKSNQKGSFASLISKMIDLGHLELQFLKRYTHRIDTTGQPLYYVGMIGKKTKSLPIEILASS